MYTIFFTKKAEKHLTVFRKTGNQAVLKKIDKLLDELRDHPRTGTGKPEPLKGELNDSWSRRIDRKNRIIYSIFDYNVLVEVISMLGHYDNK